MQLYRFVGSRDSCQPKQAIEPTYLVSASKKKKKKKIESKEEGEIEDEVTTTSRETEKRNSSKIPTEN